MMEFRHIHHVDSATIAALHHGYRPVFVLTTGRSGSKWVVELLSGAPSLAPFHEPRPALMHLARFAHERRGEPALLAPIIDAVRTEMVLEAMIRGRVYVESNQCLAFFAPALDRVFSSCRFVHLLRHPGDFARSAIRKGWYRNDSIWEANRPRMGDEAAWSRLDPIEKLGWLWAETNRFVSGFLEVLAPGRALTCRLEDLTASPERAQELFAFCGAEPPSMDRIRALQAQRSNELRIDSNEPPTMRKVASYPAYPDWPEAEKEKLRFFAATAARRFGYAP